jgi:hypothetical protein
MLLQYRGARMDAELARDPARADHPSRAPQLKARPECGALSEHLLAFLRLNLPCLCIALTEHQLRPVGDALHQGVHHDETQGRSTQSDTIQRDTIRDGDEGRILISTTCSLSPVPIQLEQYR